jgi:dihydroorotase
VGSLTPGSLADIVIFDADEKWVIDPEQFQSKSRNTPFGGMSVKGKVKMTLVDGRVVFDGR